jgi:hypothetical protein
MNPNETVNNIMGRRVMCDICGEVPALYDGKTRSGPWAYMCHKCMGLHGVGLGVGRGQMLKY